MRIRLASELLARELGADPFVLATDAPVVFIDCGRPEAKAIPRASLAAIRAYRFPAGWMGPKVEAACRFAQATGKTTAIGALADIPAMVTGKSGAGLVGSIRQFHAISGGLPGFLGS